jgi:hypothetical protein
MLFSLFFFIFWILVAFFLLGFILHSCKHFYSITLFINTSRVFLLIVFLFVEDWAIFNFHKKIQLWDEEKKLKKTYDKPKYQNLPYNLKCKHLQKHLQIIQDFPQLFLQAYANVNVVHL